MKRVGAPPDIAGVVAFLCSEDAAWICGQTLTVDGGLSLTSPFDLKPPGCAEAMTPAPLREETHAMPAGAEAFVPFPLLRGPHAQTIAAAKLALWRRRAAEREARGGAAGRRPHRPGSVHPAAVASRRPERSAAARPVRLPRLPYMSRVALKLWRRGVRAHPHEHARLRQRRRAGAPALPQRPQCRREGGAGGPAGRVAALRPDDGGLFPGRQRDAEARGGAGEAGRGNSPSR